MHLLEYDGSLEIELTKIIHHTYTLAPWNPMSLSCDLIDSILISV